VGRVRLDGRERHPEEGEGVVIVKERTRDASGVTVSLEPVAARRPWPPLAAVLALLPLAALTELFLVRTFYRVGVYIPKEGPFRTVYGALTAIGSFALNLSSVLVAVALALLAAGAYRRRSRTAAFAVAAFLAASLVLAVEGTSDLGPTARLAFVLAVVVVAWPFVRSEAGRWQRLAVAGVAASALLSSYAGFVGDAGRLVPSAGGPGGAVGSQLAAEALVIATAFAFLGAWVASDRLRAGPLLLALGPAVALLVAWRANGAVTGILVLWTAGLRLYLPVWLYAVALWAFAAAAIGWLPRHGWRSAGLGLLLVAGMLLESTYVQGLALVALVLLTDGVAAGGLPQRIHRVELGGAHDPVRLVEPLGGARLDVGPRPLVVVEPGDVRPVRVDLGLAVGREREQPVDCVTDPDALVAQDVGYQLPGPAPSEGRSRPA